MHVVKKLFLITWKHLNKYLYLYSNIYKITKSNSAGGFTSVFSLLSSKVLLPTLTTKRYYELQSATKLFKTIYTKTDVHLPVEN